MLQELKFSRYRYVPLCRASNSSVKIVFTNLYRYFTHYMRILNKLSRWVSNKKHQVHISLLSQVNVRLQVLHSLWQTNSKRIKIQECKNLALWRVFDNCLHYPQRVIFKTTLHKNNHNEKSGINCTSHIVVEHIKSDRH